MADLVHIFWWVDVWNITRVEDIVDVFKEDFTFDLCISEQEHNGLVFEASLHQTLPQVLLPLSHPIVLGQLYLETVILCYVGRKPGK